jgi:hypothetical protein
MSVYPNTGSLIVFTSGDLGGIIAELSYDSGQATSPEGDWVDDPNNVTYRWQNTGNNGSNTWYYQETVDINTFSGLTLAITFSNTGSNGYYEIENVELNGTVYSGEYRTPNQYNLINTFGSSACLTENCNVLTPNGYINVSTLKINDKILTPDNRIVPIKNIYKSRITIFS